MEVISTTNPIPPTGGANATAPLGISTSFTTTLTSEALKQKVTEARSMGSEILIDTFEISSLTEAPSDVYTWSTISNKLSAYYPSLSFLPWNLVKPYYANMLNMEYILIFKPYKVSDASVKIQGEIRYDLLHQPLGPNTFANHNFIFDFNDTSDEFILAIPQYFQHINLLANNPILTIGTSERPAFLPTTSIKLRVMNTYQPNAIIPDTFNVQVFLIVIPNNMKNISAPRELVTGFDSPVNKTPIKYFMT